MPWFLTSLEGKNLKATPPFLRNPQPLVCVPWAVGRPYYCADLPSPLQSQDEGDCDPAGGLPSSRRRRRWRPEPVWGCAAGAGGGRV